MAGKNRRSFDLLGYGLVGFGVAVAGGLGVANKAAVDFESSFAGVRKTVDATEPQFERLARGFRDLATEIPVNVNELNRIGEAAGQLGIQREAVLGFTETVAKLGVTTNLAGEQAATGLARIGNIMQTPQAQLERMGAAIVALGNAGASTESEIVEMSLRIAGAGKQVGLTESEVLGFANALSSVGIHAESGGSAISRTFIEIATAVEEGGEKLEGFASTAGLSVEEFATAFEQDAAGATIAFIEGLGGIDAAGGNVFQTLKSLGLSEIRVRDALLRASGAGDLFRESLELGNTAWKENNALNEEAARRFETTASQTQIAKNEINDLAITVGNVTKPIVEFGTVALGGLASTVNDLPGPIQVVGVGIAGLLGASSLAAGGFLLLAPRIIETKKAIEALGVASKFTTLGRFARGIGLLGVAFVALPPIIESATKRVSDFIDTLGSEGAEAAFQGWIDGIDLVDDTMAGNIITQDEYRRQFRKHYQDVPLATQALSGFSSSIVDVALRLGDQAEAHMTVADAMKEQRRAQLQLAGGFTGLIANMDEVSRSEQELKDARRNLIRLTENGKRGTDEYRAAQERYRDAQLGAVNANISATQAIRDYAKELAEADTPQRKVIELVKGFGTRAGLTREEIGDLIDEVKEHIDTLGKIPKDKRTNVDAPGLDKVHSKVKELLDFFSRMPGSLAIQADIRGSAGAGPALALAGTSQGGASRAAAIVPGQQYMTSGYRPGDTDSYHSVPPPRFATDWVGANLTQMYGLLKATNPTEMILDHKIYQKGTEAYYAPSDHTGLNRHLHYYLEHGGYFAQPTSGFMSLAERQPEIVSPVPMLQRIVRDSQGSPTFKIVLAPKRGFEGIERFIDARVEVVNEKHRATNARLVRS